MKAYDELMLFTPGPVNVPPRVLAAGARPMLHHRTPEFSGLLASTVEKAQQLLGTQQDVLLVHSTGRGAMEGAILNLFSPGDEVIAVANGRFGEMFGEIAGTHGLTVHQVCSSWHAPAELAQIEQALLEHPDVKAVTVSHCETATAVINDIQGIAALCKRHGKLILVDGVSSVGSIPFEFDRWQIDVLITASQKGLMCPTGLSLVVLSDQAWQAVDHGGFPVYYIRFRDIQKNLRGKQETPGSTPVSLVANLEAALTMIMEEGLDSCYRRHAMVAAAIRAGLAGMGLQLFPPTAERRSPGLSAFTVPAGLTSSGLRQALKTGYGLVAAEGLGPYKESVVRVGHIGYVYPRDALTFVAALEATLLKLGYLPRAGAGTAACIAELNRQDR